MRDYANVRGDTIPNPYQNLLAPLFAMAYGNANTGNIEPPDIRVPESGYYRRQSGYYRRQSGDIECVVANVRFRTLEGQIKKVYIDCVQGATGKNFVFESNGSPCVSGSDSVEIFDNAIEISIAGKRSDFANGDIVVLKPGKYTRIEGNYNCSSASIKESSVDFISLSLEGNCNATVDFDCNGLTCKSRSYAVALNIQDDQSFEWLESSYRGSFKLDQ